MVKRRPKIPQGAQARTQPVKKHHHRWRWNVVIGIFAFSLIVAVGRLLLPGMVRDYVYRTLDRSPLYAGQTGAVHLQLLRGAYTLTDVRISKTTVRKVETWPQ